MPYCKYFQVLVQKGDEEGLEIRDGTVLTAEKQASELPQEAVTSVAHKSLRWDEHLAQSQDVVAVSILFLCRVIAGTEDPLQMSHFYRAF
jgi:hypothetical protein